VHFEASTCEVSAKDHPYAWELKTTATPSGGLVYHEDFSDPKSGWPNRSEQIRSEPPQSPRYRQIMRQEYQPGLRYIPGGYEISRHAPPNLSSFGLILDGVVAAYGTPWDNLRASVSVQADWTRTFRPPRGKSSGDGLLSKSYSEIAPGLVFHLNNDGYYALVLAGGVAFGLDGPNTRIVQFKLVKTLFGEDGPAQDSVLIPWKQISSSAIAEPHKISVEYKDGQITVMVDDRQAESIHDDGLRFGLTGMAVFGRGDAIFHDLLVQDLR